MFKENLSIVRTSLERTAGNRPTWPVPIRANAEGSREDISKGEKSGTERLQFV